MFVMNKNVHHNGKSYQKDFIIEKGDEGFEALQKAGHVEEAVKADGHVDGAEAYKKYHKKDDAKVEAEGSSEPEAEAEGESEGEGKPARRRR